MSIGEGTPSTRSDNKYEPWELDLGTPDIDMFGPQFTGKSMYLQDAVGTVVAPHVPIENLADVEGIAGPYDGLVETTQLYYEQQATELNRGEAIVQPGRGIN